MPYARASAPSESRPRCREITYIFQCCLQPCHAEDGDPDGHSRAQEVAVLQSVIVEDTQHRLPRLVAGMIELRGRMVSRGSDLPTIPTGEKNMEKNMAYRGEEHGVGVDGGLH